MIKNYNNLTFGNQLEKFYTFYPEHFSKNVQDNIVKTITFQVTDACNLCCSYCYQINKGHHVMPFEIAKQFIDKLLNDDETFQEYIQSQTTTGCVLEFIGGEPFLEIKLIDQIIDYFMEQTIILNHPWATKFRVSLSSNGTLYFTPEVQEFIKKHNQHLSLSISIDGNKQLHDNCRVFSDGKGSYDLAISAEQDFGEKYNPNLLSKMTLSPENINYTSNALINLMNNNHDYIYANCIFEQGWTIEHATILYNELKKVADYILENNLETKKGISILDLPLTDIQKHSRNENWCGGDGRMIAIDWKGDIFPCLRYMESSIGQDQSPYTIGNVYEGIGQTAETKRRIEDLDVTWESQNPPECIECPVSEGCAWCSAYNYQIFGTINKRTTFTCDMHKARVLANYYYQNKLAEKYYSKKLPFLIKKEDSIKIIGDEETKYLIKLSQD